MQSPLLVAPWTRLRNTFLEEWRYILKWNRSEACTYYRNEFELGRTLRLDLFRLMTICVHVNTLRVPRFVNDKRYTYKGKDHIWVWMKVEEKKRKAVVIFLHNMAKNMQTNHFTRNLNTIYALGVLWGKRISLLDYYHKLLLCLSLLVMLIDCSQGANSTRACHPRSVLPASYAWRVSISPADSTRMGCCWSVRFDSSSGLWSNEKWFG